MADVISFIPQVRHSWRTRDLSGISVRMYNLFTVGVALWLIYAIVLGSRPIAVTNAITLVLAGIVLFLKLTTNDIAARARLSGQRITAPTRRTRGSPRAAGRDRAPAT